MKFSSPDEYFEWREHNFGLRGLPSTTIRHGTEWDFRQRELADDALRRSKLKKNVSANRAEQLLDRAKSNRERAAIRRLVEGIASRGRLLSEERFFEPLLSVARKSHCWVREPIGWTPGTHNIDRQFSGLLRHLFALYPIPKFLDGVWMDGSRADADTRRSWFICHGQGSSIRSLDGLPMPMTRAMEHWFLQAPDDMPVLQAFRWAEVRSLGGSERLAHAISETRLGQYYANHEFWKTVVRWFLEHPMLDLVHCGPIVDYINFVRFEPRNRVVIDGRVAMVPLRPNLAMKGRDPRTLLREVETWHRGLNARRYVVEERNWTGSGRSPWRFEEGQARTPGHRLWHMVELLSTRSLVMEGRAMRHCVATYDRSCASGTVSIWSLTMEQMGVEERVLTVELHNSARCIVQARGRLNRRAEPRELQILNRWAAREGLQMAKHLG